VVLCDLVSITVEPCDVAELIHCDCYLRAWCGEVR
jgi:hypothetical protein